MNLTNLETNRLTLGVNTSMLQSCRDHPRKVESFIVVRTLWGFLYKFQRRSISIHCCFGQLNVTYIFKNLSKPSVRTYRKEGQLSYLFER